MINAILQDSVKRYSVTTANFQLWIGNIFCGPLQQRIALSKICKHSSSNDTMNGKRCLERNSRQFDGFVKFQGSFECWV
jgi:hypothetical protein